MAPLPSNIADHDVSSVSTEIRDGAFLATVTRAADDGNVAVGVGRHPVLDVAIAAAVDDLNRDDEVDDDHVDHSPARLTTPQER